jgi:hypothetical protein
MAHFAKIVDTKVVEVIVVHNNEAPTEADGKAFLASCGLDGESWTLDEIGDWQPPTPMPSTGGP